MLTTGESSPVGVAVVGAGYWGPNLIRNFQHNPDSDLKWVCDLDRDQAVKAVGRYNTIAVTALLDDVLDDPTVEGVAIATPAGTHYDIAMAALRAGKHVLVEKPLASTVTEAAAMVALGAERDLVVMCDHTYCYTPAVQKIRELVASGTLGELMYVDSVRINLGLVQRDIDVFWDLAPHDLSILNFILPPRWAPTGVAAHGADPLRTGRACVGYLTLALGAGALAHIHVNWLSPTKIRTMVIGGSRRTLVWDDLNPSQRLSVFDRGVDVEANVDDERKREILVSYRLGDMTAPALVEGEALQGALSEFVGCIREGRAPATDGSSGVRVLQVLEAADRSRGDDGRLTCLT
ncbi:MAG TPA: Gfo/Idh/MocA family oxidoreductase [Acidimicrobiales bacterium]|nr:Gfo/Idh/MocA family oxidoreductase [Acidimicrobiales bacterium]